MRPTGPRLVRPLAVAVALATATSSAALQGPTLRAAAPRTPATASTAARPAADLYAGYSYTHAGEASLNGWGIDGSYPLTPRLRLVADLTGHYGSFAGVALSQTALMAGARHTWEVGGLRPFAEALLGVARTSSSFESLRDADTDWGFAIGGGADYPLSRRLALRALLHLRLLEGEGSWDADPRVSVGAAYRFGR
jgi:opacity protein-like surface antigen